MALKNAIGRASLSILVAGKWTDFGYFDTNTGGDWDIAETKYTPFDGEQRTYLGQPTDNNVTIDRDYTPNDRATDVDLVNGSVEYRGLPAKSIIYDKDANGNWQQNRKPYSGLVKQIIPPDGDSNDASTVAKISVVLSIGKVTS